ncbi:MAG: branched-chain amino acid ABC transporter permease [Chloroflexi bacterium]|nr:branched-chain amino acid ABC transporter permease [Chloroflexota bacterium]
MSRRSAVFVGIVGLLAVVPFLPFGIPILFSGSLDSAGTLQVLAVGLVFAALAMSYDILFGSTGLLSFGHALPFALGSYGTNLLMIHAGLPYPIAIVVAVASSVLIAVVVGALALRTVGVAFAMVTLAVAEAFSLLVLTDPLRILGGEEGLPLATAQVPALFRGVVNLPNVYWLALALAVATFLIGRRVVSSRAGRVFAAIRENEPRVEMMGLRPFPFKLASFVTASTLAALAGSVYLLVVRGSNVGITTPDFTLAIVVMVVLGGAGRLWGAALGGLVYGILTLRLAAVATSETIDALPHWLSGPLSEPLFILGVLFILFVLFAPGGLSSLRPRITRRPRRGPMDGDPMSPGTTA